jgi:hypothetical protein
MSVMGLIQLSGLIPQYLLHNLTGSWSKDRWEESLSVTLQGHPIDTN